MKKYNFIFGRAVHSLIKISEQAQAGGQKAERGLKRKGNFLSASLQVLSPNALGTAPEARSIEIPPFLLAPAERIGF
ncbi:MAG: hypothetical protein ACPLZH_01360 [Minisyncoccales bacterium]